MDYKLLKDLIDQDKSIRDIARLTDKGFSTIRYWLNKHKLSTNHKSRSDCIYIKCNVCDKIINDKRRRRCKSCTTRIRRFRTKTAAVKLLGNKCQNCDWAGDIAAFEFHHDSAKEFEIGNASNKSWEIVKKEVQKCKLLCSNCHRIEHAGDRSEKFIKAVKNYKGSILGL